MDQATFMTQQNFLLSSAIIISTFLMSGCGTKEYEMGLNETAKYYEHLDKINRNLSPKEWKGSGISIRVPSQFDLVRSPDEDSKKDPRQPTFLDVEFPGLLATWKAEVDVANVEEKVPCYIYLLSNASLWNTEARSDVAMNYTSEITQRLANGLKVQFPDNSSVEQIPPQKGYVQKKSFRTTSIFPDKDFKLSEDSPEVAVQADTYLAEKGDIQVAIIFLYPQEIDGNEKFPQRIPLCLESFELRGGTASNSSGGASSSGKGKKKRSPDRKSRRALKKS